MIRSYKNKEFISSLSEKQLKDYYACLTHHGKSRRNCCQSSDSSQHSTGCPCTGSDSNGANHFCTSCGPSTNQCRSADCQMCSGNSLVVCENYKPSYTAKEDQIKSLRREVGLMRRCKSSLQDAMKDLDKLLEECGDRKDSDQVDSDNRNSVEKFYRSKEFIGSSMNIKSLKEYVPRTDISHWTYEVDIRDMSDKKDPSLAAPLFGFFRSTTFMDHKILQNQDFKKGKESLAAATAARPVSGIVYVKKNSHWRP